jgi:hypothetical protein
LRQLWATTTSLHLKSLHQTCSSRNTVQYHPLKAIVAACLKSVEDWNSSVIDEILQLGDGLHLKTLQIFKTWIKTRYWWDVGGEKWYQPQIFFWTTQNEKDSCKSKTVVISNQIHIYTRKCM